MESATCEGQKGVRSLTWKFGPSIGARSLPGGSYGPYDVLIRPGGEHGLVLLDGLSKAHLDILHQRGFGSVVTLDIDRERYQAWIKLSAGPISEHTRERAARGLKKGLGLHEGTEKKEKDSRLGGLVNGAAVLKNGHAPYVLVTETAGRLAPAGHAYLQQIHMETTKEIALREKQRDKSRGRSR